MQHKTVQLYGLYFHAFQQPQTLQASAGNLFTVVVDRIYTHNGKYYTILLSITPHSTNTQCTHTYIIPKVEVHLSV